MEKGMKGVILKTALTTLLAVIIALVLASGILCLGFPQTVAELFEKSGNYSAAIPFVSLRYTYTDSVYDLARCAEDSILAEDYNSTASFCRELTEREDFAELCEKKDGQTAKGYYRSYIYGNYADALYKSGKADEALTVADTVMEGAEGFPAGNVYAKLAIAVAEANDGATALKLLDRLNKITPSETEKIYFDKVKKVVSDIGI